MKSGDNASKYLEDLLNAEKKAIQAKVGVHKKGSPPIQVFSDLVSNTKQAKEFEAMIIKKDAKKMNAVVEYCFSGMRFKVRLEDEGRMIALNLLGIKTMLSDKNQPTLQEYANDAHKLAKDNLF